MTNRLEHSHMQLDNLLAHKIGFIFHRLNVRYGFPNDLKNCLVYAAVATKKHGMCANYLLRILCIPSHFKRIQQTHCSWQSTWFKGKAVK